MLLSRRELAAGLRGRSPAASPVGVVVLACVPAAIAGKLLQQQIERRLGTPRTIAAALAAGGLAMAAADRREERSRTRAEAGAADGMALGAAQAIALIPGVSRSGATAAVGLPITLGALALKGREAARHSDRSEWASLGAGALASFSSTLATAGALARVGRDHTLLPYATYRVALAAAVVRRLRQNGGR
jgi:undecaprenyl-diphosphatase